jgi:RimJ/RimL family protein N-acetyltransferase
LSFVLAAEGIEKTMANRKTPNIVIKKINLERIGDFYDAMVESGEDWFNAGMIPKPDLSRNELKNMVKAFIALWEQDNAYMFYVIDGTNNQIAGIAALNQIYRTHQIGNLAYLVRTNRTGEGIATEAARLVARYGFEKLGLQRIEIVVQRENLPSLKVADKLGSKREALLRNRVLLHGIPREAYLHSLIPTDFVGNTA